MQMTVFTSLTLYHDVLNTGRKIAMKTHNL